MFHSPVKPRFASFIRLCFALGFLLSLASWSAASAAGTVIVDVNNADWVFAPEGGGSLGTGQFVVGPATPPLGDGSAELTSTAPADGVVIAAALFQGTRLDDLTTLTYETYRTSGGPEQAPALQFNIDYDLTDGIVSWQGRLVYEPYQTGTNPTSGTWETWDALAADARWWSSGAPGNGTCPQSSPCDLATLLTAFPDAGVHATLGAVLFKAGSGWTGFQGNVDNFVIGVNGDNTTFDFEPFLPVHNITQGTDHPTIQDGVDNANPGDVLEADPGTYEENVVIDKSLTLRGAGAGTDPAQHTILDGTNLGTASGIHINTNVTDVTLEDFRVQNYSTSGFSTAGIFAQGGNDNFVAQDLEIHDNTGGAAGLYMNGSVDNVLIDNVEAHNNTTRGIVIWNGVKTNITITNNDARGNNCCGIELQDGTASGVTMSGNTAIDNGDSGMSAIGLTSGAGANVIANNVVRDNGRFGIEIKLPNGTGATSGDGSIVVEDNDVSFTTDPGMNDRDHAGIAIFRRSFITGQGYADIPTGVVVRNNTVTGYMQTNPSSDSDGFGIVVEGLNMTVAGNTLEDNDVGLQYQAGHTPYTANASGDGDQSDLNDDYFGRGNSPVACVAVGSNTFANNSVDSRGVGANAGMEFVTNLDTGERFCSLQDAINDSDTDDGDTLEIDAGTFTTNSQVVVDKDLTIQGQSQSTTTLLPGFDTGSGGDSRGWFLVTAGTVLDLADLTLDGTGNLVFQAIRHRGSGTVNNVTFTEIKFNESGPNYSGVAIAAFGDGAVDVTNSTFTEIGRIGVLYFGNGVDGSLFDNNSYTGKGDGDFLDYMVDINAGAEVTVTNNEVSDNRGVASVDGSTSAGILVSTFSGPGTMANITGNEITNSTTGIFVGFDNADASTVTANRNAITGNDNGMVNASETNVVDGLCNWWGDVSGPSGEGPGSGDSVDEAITFTPWLTSSDLNGSCNTEPELSLAKTGPASVTAGDTIVFTLDYENLSTVAATGVTLEETVPANSVFNAGMSTAGWSCVPDGSAGSTCTLAVGSLAGLEQGSAEFAVDTLLAAAGSDLVNEASISDDGSASDMATATTFVNHPPASCDPASGFNVIIGTDKKDTIDGTPGNDIIFGLEGNDHIEGMGGNDCIIGGEGHDDLSGDDGNDIIWGGEENNSTIYTSNDNDKLYGGDGDDVMHGGGRDDRLEGGDGDDMLYGDDRRDKLYGNNGNDMMWGGDDRDTLDGGDGDDEMWGDDGDDSLFGKDGNDDLYGGEGRDKLYGGQDNDIIRGGIGNDTLDGSDGEDDLYGDEGRDRLSGGDDNDYLAGGSEDDRLYGGKGDDEMYGDAGNDRLYGSNGNDLLDGGADTDRLDGGKNTDVCTTGESLKNCEGP